MTSTHALTTTNNEIIPYSVALELDTETAGGYKIHEHFKQLGF